MLSMKLQKKAAKTRTSTNITCPNKLFSFGEKNFLPWLRKEGGWPNYTSPQCLSFAFISTGKTLPRWLKIMKSKLAGKETILHPSNSITCVVVSKVGLKTTSWSSICKVQPKRTIVKFWIWTLHLTSSRVQCFMIKKSHLHHSILSHVKTKDPITRK